VRLTSHGSYLGERQNFTGQHFWAQGYYVSTVRRDAVSIHEYIQKQQEEDAHLDQLNIFEGNATFI